MCKFGNFFLLSLFLVGIVYSGKLHATENENLIVTRVTVETPLPTGLESVAVAGADESNQFYKEIKEDPRIKPFVSAAEKKYVKKISDAEKYANHATVEVDCEKSPVSYGTKDESKCYVLITRSYGWYADLSLILQIEGYADRNWLKKSKVL